MLGQISTLKPMLKAKALILDLKLTSYRSCYSLVLFRSPSLAQNVPINAFWIFLLSLQLCTEHMFLNFHFKELWGRKRKLNIFPLLKFSLELLTQTLKKRESENSADMSVLPTYMEWACPISGEARKGGRSLDRKVRRVGKPPCGYWKPRPSAGRASTLNCLVSSQASSAGFLKTFLSGPGGKMWF